MSNKFSENLKRLRKERNLSQEQLADVLGVSRQAISKWESAIAYPEMDKIILLCDKFDVNIDDLLHKDIREVNKEIEGKKKINILIGDFLLFITDSINMFSNMRFKSKIKCLFEQFVIAALLCLFSIISFSLLDSLFSSLFVFLPSGVNNFVDRVFESILITGFVIVSFVILFHIFKVRYLDYYKELMVDLNGEDNHVDYSGETNNSVSDKKNYFNRENDKIVIRDPRHSEYKFINGLFKLIIGIIKFLSLCLCLFVVLVLIFLLASFIISFLLYKTGFFFVGLLLVILSSSIITIILLLLLLNFIFNRKSDKKKMIWSFILSLIVLGIGSGFIFVGTLSFEIVNDAGMMKTVTKEYKMKDQLLLLPSVYNVEYVERNSSNIKVEYYTSMYCSISDYVHIHDSDNSVNAWTDCDELRSVKEFVKNVNNRKLVPINNGIEKVIVYTNKQNIEKLKHKRLITQEMY